MPSLHPADLAGTSSISSPAIQSPSPSDGTLVAETLNSVVLAQDGLELTDEELHCSRAKRKRDPVSPHMSLADPNAVNCAEASELLAPKRQKVRIANVGTHLGPVTSFTFLFLSPSSLKTVSASSRMNLFSASLLVLAVSTALCVG